MTPSSHSLAHDRIFDALAHCQFCQQAIAHDSICASSGHANVQTDIKEAIFIGHNDELVAAGSDDGFVFIYDTVTGQVVKILQADEDVANCVQVVPLSMSIRIFRTFHMSDFDALNLSDHSL